MIYVVDGRLEGKLYSPMVDIKQTYFCISFSNKILITNNIFSYYRKITFKFSFNKQENSPAIDIKKIHKGIPFA